jgi:hypothetical protein
MKETTINTYLRPAVASDVFTNSGVGEIIEDKHFFYKESNGDIYGPHRLRKPFNENNTMLYLELFQLLNDKRMFLVDPFQYKESIAIELPLKAVEEDDILQNKILIINTAYFLKRGQEISGAFYITKHTTKKILKTKAKDK